MVKDSSTLRPIVRLQLHSTATPERTPGPTEARVASGADKGSPEPKGVQSVERAFEILRVVEANRGSVSVSQVASALDSSPSRVHHYLVSLVRCGALRQTGRGSYDLGPTSLALGLSALSRVDTVERTCELAEGLRDAVGESVFVAVWGNRGPTTVRYFEGYRAITVEARAGLVLPLMTSATGRVFLAWENPANTESLLAQEGGVPSDIEVLRQRTREQGLGCVDGDLLPRIAALSAPVFAYGEGLSLAMTVLGWSGETDFNVNGNTACALKTCCADLSAEFGWRGH